MIILRLPHTLEQLQTEQAASPHLDTLDPGSWSDLYRNALLQRYHGQESCIPLIKQAADMRSLIKTLTPSFAISNGYMYRLVDDREAELQQLQTAQQLLLERLQTTSPGLIFGYSQDYVEDLYLMGEYQLCQKQYKLARQNYRGHIEKLRIYLVAEMARAAESGEATILEPVIRELYIAVSPPKRSRPNFTDPYSINQLNWLEEACKIHSRLTGQLHPYLLDTSTQ